MSSTRTGIEISLSASCSGKEEEVWPGEGAAAKAASSSSPGVGKGDAGGEVSMSLFNLTLDTVPMMLFSSLKVVTKCHLISEKPTKIAILLDNFHLLVVWGVGARAKWSEDAVPLRDDHHQVVFEEKTERKCLLICANSFLLKKHGRFNWRCHSVNANALLCVSNPPPCFARTH